MVNKKHGQTLPANELSSYCEEMSMMLAAGVQLWDGLDSLAQTYAASPRAVIYRELAQGLLETGSLSEAMKRDSKWPAHLAEMAGIGECTGRLDQVMAQMAGYYQREERIREAAVSAVTYPMVLATMLVVIILVMLVTVLPVFRRMLGSMGVVLTASGQALTNVGFGLGWIVLGLVGLLMLCVLGGVLAYRYGNPQQVRSWLVAHFPLVRKQQEKLSSCRIFSVLSMMVGSGFQLSDALQMVLPVLEDEKAVSKVKVILEGMDSGRPFGELLEESKLLDEIHTRMVCMAVSIGREDEVMGKIAASYEEAFEEGMNALVSIIEPTLVVLLCVVIGAVLMAVMLPMASIISGIL